MAKLSDFIPKAELDAYLKTAPDVLAGKIEQAKKVVAYAQSISPVDSGKYKKGIKVRRYGRTGVGVVWTDPISNIIEFGSNDTPEFAIKAKTEEHFNHRGIT